jgi:hypothetical protein
MVTAGELETPAAAAIPEPGATWPAIPWTGTRLPPTARLPGTGSALVGVGFPAALEAEECVFTGPPERDGAVQ